MLMQLGSDRPQLAPDVYVAPTAMLIGKVRAGAGCSFWFGTVVRGDNDWISFDQGTNVQDGCLCHVDDGIPLVVGKRCTIGHHAVLHGCTLEDEVLIGIGARVLNEAYIEREVIVAAGSLVPERARLPSGWLYLGVPARPVRELTEQDRERIRRGADNYLRHGVLYRDRAHLLPG